MFINILAYIDDAVLIAPWWRGLQQMLDIVVHDVISGLLHSHRDKNAESVHDLPHFNPQTPQKGHE